jgi:hypothetical protein
MSICRCVEDMLLSALGPYPIKYLDGAGGLRAFQRPRLERSKHHPKLAEGASNVGGQVPPSIQSVRFEITQRTISALKPREELISLKEVLPEEFLISGRF